MADIIAVIKDVRHQGATVQYVMNCTVGSGIEDNVDVTLPFATATGPTAQLNLELAAGVRNWFETVWGVIFQPLEKMHLFGASTAIPLN